MSQAMRRSPWRMSHYARLLGRMHAGLHRISAPTFPGLPGRVRRNLDQATLLSEARKAAVLRLLEGLPDEPTLCHGDFHPENIILAAGGPLVIDWEGSMQGSRSGDVAAICLWIRRVFLFGKGWPYRQIGLRFERNYLSEYQRASGSLDHFEQWITILAACRMNEENASEFRYLEAMIRHTIPDIP